jgi:hypothetical protein
MSLSHDETRRKLAEVDKQQQMAFDAVQEANVMLVEEIEKLKVEIKKLKEVKP